MPPWGPDLEKYNYSILFYYIIYTVNITIINNCRIVYRNHIFHCNLIYEERKTWMNEWMIPTFLCIMTGVVLKVYYYKTNCVPRCRTSRKCSINNKINTFNSRLISYNICTHLFCCLPSTQMRRDALHTTRT